MTRSLANLVIPNDRTVVIVAVLLESALSYSFSLFVASFIFGIMLCHDFLSLIHLFFFIVVAVLFTK
jgi:hypothetical protein